MRVTISSGLIDQILAHAAAEPGREVCGLLFGGDSHIDAALPTANVASDPACHFEVDPQALFAAIRAERGGGARLVGHYHSHPSGLPAPSARDAADAEPGRLWLIVAGGEARLWRSVAGGAFVPIALERA
jgi:proteasome lid subunit RPN8/RPN11